MQKPNETQDIPQVDRFTDRLLNALANLDRYANGYEKREASAPSNERAAADTPDAG
jgi:hypothetical protein